MPSLTQEVVSRQLDQLAAVDGDVARALGRWGHPAPRQWPQGFATLLRIMVGQQLSTRAAAAIWRRLVEACGPVVAPGSFLALDDQALRAVGFGQRKIAHGRGLAEAVVTGNLDLAALDGLAEVDVVAAITALAGFGRWSAEVYLLFALGRADVLPGDDLALQVGMQRLKGLTRRPDRRAMEALAEPWRPRRGCGAIFLWHLYGAATLDEGAR